MLRSLSLTQRVWHSRQFSNLHQRNAVAEVFNPQKFHNFTVTKREQLSHDVVKVTLVPPSAEFAQYLKPTSYFYATLPDQSHARPYSPVSTMFDKDRIEMVVRRYPEGKMSGFIFNLRVGDMMMLKGPLPKMLQYKPNMKKKIGLIGGGTGITPLLQILKAALNPPEVKDTTEFVMLYGNKTEDDILCKDILDQLVKDYCGRLTAKYVVEKPNNPQTWQARVGMITKSLIEDYMPKPSPDHLIAICGPPPMVNAISGLKDPKDFTIQGPLAGYLKELGYTSDMVFKF